MMPGFWVKATIAAAIAIIVVYGTVKLKRKWPGCLTGSIMVVTFFISPIIWAIMYYNIPIYYFEPFKGRVTKSGTGEPIPGAAVMVKYLEEGPTVHGTMTFYIGVKEAKTDENGEYYIPSEWRLRRGGTPYGHITIFKPGYSVERKYNVNFIVTMFWPNSDHRFWNTGYKIYELDKLITKKERIDNLNKIITIGADHDKIEFMLTLIEQERVNVGFKPSSTRETRKRRTENEE